MIGDNGPRRCSRCGELKPIAEFSWAPRCRKRDTYCRPCRSAYGKEHYAANKQRYIDQAMARKRARRRDRALFFIDYFAAHPCTDCGTADPVVLEFDHVGPKEFDIGKGFERYSWARILKEIEVCEVVCANCHRRRTARRAGSWRAVLTDLGGGAGDGS